MPKQAILSEKFMAGSASWRWCGFVLALLFASLATFCSTSGQAQLLSQLLGGIPQNLNISPLSAAFSRALPAAPQLGAFSQAAAPILRGEFLSPLNSSERSSAASADTTSEDHAAQNDPLLTVDDVDIDHEELPEILPFWLNRRASASWLAPSGSNGFAMTDVELSTSFAPWSRRHRRALLVTPGFGFHSWIAPSVLTLPARVFDTYIDVSWRSRLTERFGVNLGVTPGLYGDFNSFGSSVFQVTGWGLGEITITPKLTLLGGVAVVRQLKSHVLPVGRVMAHEPPPNCPAT